MSGKEFKETLNEYLQNMEDFEIIDEDKKSLYGIYRGHTLYFQSYVKGIKNAIFESAEEYEDICESIVNKIEKNEVKLKKLQIRKIRKINVKNIASDESVMSIEDREAHYKAMIKYYENKIEELHNFAKQNIIEENEEIEPVEQFEVVIDKN